MPKGWRKHKLEVIISGSYIIHELQILVTKLRELGYVIIVKLPPNWNDYKKENPTYTEKMI